MKFEFLKNVTRKISYKTEKHLPEIALVVGLVGVPVTVGLAIKATLKVDQVVEEVEGQLYKIEETKDAADDSVYSEEDATRDKYIVYTRAGLKLAKLYGPTMISGAITMGAIFGGYKVLNGRYLATAASLAGLDATFKDYRKRVAEKYGEEAEKDIRYGIKSEEVLARIKDPETGEEKEVKDIALHHEKKPYGDYVKYFDASSGYWEKSPEYNLAFLLKVQRYWNEQIKTRRNGIVFLNEVLKSLGIEETRAGQIAGWKYDPKDPNFCIDFGIFRMDSEANRRFVNGLEDTILLDFNCVPDVYSELETII